MANDTKVFKHPSYGIIGISRIQGGSGVLFGSPIKHPTRIMLRVYKALRYRSLSEDRFSPDERVPLVELELSESQFARMITAPNIGDGEPCTLRTIRDGSAVNLPAPTPEDLASDFHEDVREYVKEAVQRIDQLQKKVESLFTDKKNIGQKDREAILSEISQCKMHVQENMPFVLHQFEEHLEKQVSNAKNDIDSFLKIRSQQVGLKAMADVEAPAFPALPAPSKE